MYTYIHFRSKKVSEGNPKLKIGDKEIEIDEKVISTLNEYVRTQMSLEELAKALNLSGWEEAYELIKAVPSWLAWSNPSLQRVMKTRDLGKN